MSWRDRLARHDPGDHADTASRATETIGTIGTVGSETLSTTTDHAGAVSRSAGGANGTIGKDTLLATVGHADGKEGDKSNHDSSPAEVQASFAVSAESAIRAENPHPVCWSDDVVSAENANRPGRKPWGEPEEARATIIEGDGGAVRERQDTSSEPALLSPRIWFDRFGPPGEPPLDQPCGSRCGFVERRGAVFLHFCITCGAWGAFGYDAVGDLPGRWYCYEHRPRPEP